MSERVFTILNQAISTATSITTVPHGDIPETVKGICMQAAFTYGAGGTSVIAYLQTSLDDGATYFDIACFSFTTSSLTNMYTVNNETARTTAVVPTNATLAANTVVNGLVGNHLRVRYVTTGTYTGVTLLKIDLTLMV